MSYSTLTQTLLGSLLDSPAVVDVTSQLVEQAVPIIKEHFTLSAAEITKAYQNGCGYAFVAISVGLDTPDQKFSFIQKLRYSNVTREFAQQIERHYLQPFVKQDGLSDSALSDFRKPAIESLRAFSKNTDKLFEIKALSEEDLAALIGHRDTLTITELVLEQMQRIAPVDHTLAAFLRYDDQLGNAVLFFFRELIRQDDRLGKTQTALQQEGLCLDVQTLQAKLKSAEENILKAIKDNSPNLVEFAQQRDQLIQVQTAWQNRHDQLIRFQSRFETRTDEILAWVQEVYTTLDKIEKDVETTKKTTEETQAFVIENNAILRNLNERMAQLGLSSRVSPRDEFTQFDNESQQLIEAAVEQLGQLPSITTEYSQVSIKVGCALSSMGKLEKAENLFIQAIEKAKNDEDKALAYFNIFQVRWRKGFAEITVSVKEQYYAKALSALQKAIDLSNGRYALHDINKGYFPIEKLLGAGGMGCAFLCENHNYLIKGHKWVVIKCFWENIAGSLDTVFKEPLALDKIAGDLVPKPLDYGYADNVNKQGPYFVTEYVEGAIDGEAYLEKYGPLDLKLGLLVALQIAEGLRRAHEVGIYHLDLKPANLLLKRTDGGIAVKIIDFGLSRVTTSLRDVAVQRSQSGKSVFEQAVFGTLEYAPPEQRGYARHYGNPSAKSDIFAFGKTMYRLLTGEIPFAVEQELLEHAPEWYQLLCDCVRQNPEKRPESAKVLISRLEGLDENLQPEEKELLRKEIERAERQAEDERKRKEQEARERAERQAKEQNKKAQQKPREKQPFDWQEFKPTLIVLALIGLGITITIFSVSLSVYLFEFLNISFIGGYLRHEIGAIVGLLLSILLVGQYLWRHRQTMPHLAMTLGLIVVGSQSFLTSFVIFDVLTIRFLGYGDEKSGIIVGLSISISLLGQYLWRHRQLISFSALITGLIGIAIWSFVGMLTIWVRGNCC